MWLSRPVYELLPYGYMLLGALLLFAARYASSGWSSLLLIIGAGLLIVGIVLWLRRRDYRRSQREYNSRSLDE